MCGYDGQGVQFVEDGLVLRVRQVLDHRLKSLVDTLYHLVVARAEEHLYRVGGLQQTVLMRVLLDVAAYPHQFLGVLDIVGVVDDHLFLIYMSLGAYAQHLEQDVLVHVDVEHSGVAVGLECEEYCQRSQHGSGYQFAEQHCPVAVACHLHSRVLEDVIHYEHEHRDNHRHSQSALADDGAQRGTDEEEDDTCQRQRNLADGLNLVGSHLAVERVGIVALHAYHHLLGIDTADGSPHDVLLGFERLAGEDGVDVHFAGFDPFVGFE